MELEKIKINEKLSNDIDNVLSNINEYEPVKLRDYTPKVMIDVGVRNLPMYENPAHIRKNILTEQEAKNIGLSISKRDHFHGLGKDLYMQIIDSLDNPRVIFKRNSVNEFFVLTFFKDKKNNNIVVPIEIETSTTANHIKIDINRIKTVYGYDSLTHTLNDYIKHTIQDGEFEKVYEYKKRTRYRQ